MKLPDRGWRIALWLVPLVIVTGVYLLGAAITLFASLDENNWRWVVGARLAIQLGGSLALGALAIWRLEAPRLGSMLVAALVGLLLSWSATPDFVEGPVELVGRVSRADVERYNNGRNVQATLCLVSERGKEVCLDPIGIQVHRVQAQLSGCKDAPVRVRLLRHLNAVLSASCTTAPAAVEDEGAWKARRQLRLGETALAYVRALPSGEREDYGRYLATADGDLFFGTMSKLTPRGEAWFLPGLERALMLRDDSVGIVASGWLWQLFPDSADAVAARVINRNGRNAGTLKRLTNQK